MVVSTYWEGGPQCRHQCWENPIFHKLGTCYHADFRQQVAQCTAAVLRAIIRFQYRGLMQLTGPSLDGLPTAFAIRYLRVHSLVIKCRFLMDVAPWSIVVIKLGQDP